MRERLRAWFWREQSIVVVLGTHAGWVAAALGWEATRHEQRYEAPWAWAILFAAAWLCCVVYHLRPESRRWWIWSGTALVAAYTSRAALLVSSVIVRDIPWRPDTAIGAVTWAALAVLTALLWLRLILPRPSDAR